MKSEHLKAYIASIDAHDCYAGFGFRIGVELDEAKKIARKIVADSRKMLSDYRTCVALGIPECHGEQLKPLRRERKVNNDDLLAIKAGVMTPLEFFGYAPIDGETSEYIPDVVSLV